MLKLSVLVQTSLSASLAFVGLYVLNILDSTLYSLQKSLLGVFHVAAPLSS